MQRNYRGVISILENAGLDYMIVGSVAGTIYGEPRLTRALDLVLAITPAAAPRPDVPEWLAAKA